MANDQKTKSLERVRQNCMESFGKMLDHHELLGRYLPESLEKWFESRKLLFRDPPQGAFTPRERELIAVAIEITARKPNVAGHTKRAMEAGATVHEIAEVAFTCILLAGMITYVESGQSALRAAEEYEKGRGEVIRTRKS